MHKQELTLHHAQQVMTKRVACILMLGEGGHLHLFDGVIICCVTSGSQMQSRGTGA